MTTPSLPTPLQRVSWSVVAVGALFLINGVCIANWLARVPQVRNTLHLDDRELGFILLFNALGSMTSMRLTRRLEKRFGSRAVTLAGSCAFCLSIVGPAFARSGWALAAVLFVLGGMSGLMGVCMNSQAVLLERQKGRTYLSRFHGLFSLGAMLGAGLGTAAAKGQVGLIPHLGAVAILGTGAVLLTARHMIVPRGRPAPAPDGRITLTRATVLLSLLVFASSIGEGAMADWTGIYLHDKLKTDLGTAAFGYTVFASAMLLGRLAGDRLTERFGAAPTVRVGGMLVLLGLGGGLALNTLPAVLCGIGCVGMGLSCIVPLSFRAAARNPDVPTVSALATLAALGYSGFLVGPGLIGIVSHATSLHVGLAVVASLGLPIALLAPQVSPPIEPAVSPAIQAPLEAQRRVRSR